MEEDEELHLALEMSMATNKKEEKDTRFPEFWTNLSEKQGGKFFFVSFFNLIYFSYSNIALSFCS